MSVAGRTRQALSLLFLAVLATLAAMPLAASAPPGTATGGTTSSGTTAGKATSGTSAATGKRPSKLPADLPQGRPLPDSVLATIDGERTITLGDFRRGWGAVAPPARPDTLTPQAARQFLDLLIDKELLAARATQETWEWTAVESAQVAGLKDRTMMRVALDSALAVGAKARAARGDSALDFEALGVAVRESTVAKLEVRYDDVLLERLARSWKALPRPSSDSTIWSRLKTMGQMPEIVPADSGRVVAWSKAGPVRVSELLDAWGKLNPMFRPRVESADQVRDLVKNSLFERVLRREAVQGHYDRHPTVLRAVKRQEEYLATQYYVTREVFTTIPTDDATLKREYDRNPAAWAIPTRLSVVRFMMPEKNAASRMAVRLRDPAEADSLVARGQRQHVHDTAEISAQTDSAIFARGMKSGTGTVLGPDSVSGGFEVTRIQAVLPGESRSFEEVKDLLLKSWSDEEGERRMTALLATLRKRSKIVVNKAAVDRAGREAPPPRVIGKAP